MTRVRDLTASSALTGLEKFYADDGSQDAYVTADQIKAFSSGGSLATLGWVTPQDYYADAGQPGHIADTIDADDIAAHTEWIGTYKIGSYWSYVALQEMIYGALAHHESTPGNVVWNRVSQGKNKVCYVPAGTYNINHRLLIVAQDFNFMMAARGAANIWHYGGFVIQADSHSTETLDGIDADALARIDVNDKLFVSGPGVSEGSRVMAVGTTSITLDLPTASTVAGGYYYLWCSAFVCDSAAYASFHNMTISAGCALPRGSMYDDNGIGAIRNPSQVALFVLDGTGDYGGLKTQQITIYEPRISGNYRADVGMSISPTGGAAQGDTILILNPIIFQCLQDGVQCGGNNALSIQIINGDFQNCYGSAVHSFAGSFYIDGTSFQYGQDDYHFSPPRSLVVSMNADCRLNGGGGPSSTSSVANVRSEDSVGVHCYGAGLANVDNFALSFADNTSGNRYNNFSYFPGHWIWGYFVCVSSGGPDTWYSATPQANGDTVTLSGANFSSNEWVGLRLFKRFGSNGYTQIEGLITANGTDTVTVAGADISASASTRFFIGGVSGESDPDTSGVPWTTKSRYEPVGSVQGFSTVAGSTTIFIGGALGPVHVGDWIVVPNADSLGATVNEAPQDFGGILPPIVTPLVAQITGILGSDNYTINKVPKFTMTEAPGWLGLENGVLVDGDLKWMRIDVYTFMGCGTLNKCTAISTRNCRTITGLRSLTTATDWYGQTTEMSTNDCRNALPGQIIYPKTVALNAAVTPLDVGSTVICGNYSVLTPTQSMTLTAASLGNVDCVQEWTLIVLTSGTTSFDIAFGTGFAATGTLSTGTVNNKRFILKFMSTDGLLLEISRTAAL